MHDERTRPQAKWTRENVLAALRTWAETNGRPPKAHDWYHATDEHPTFKTVADLFGRWSYAIYEAGLRKRKHPQKPSRKALLARGYHECARPGCAKLVAPSRYLCRDRQCQDLRRLVAVEPRHGTVKGYEVDGCRCDRCTEANSEYQRQYRLGQAA